MLLALVILQAIQVLFLWLHDWVPLGNLNDVAAVRATEPTARLVRVTCIQSVPFTVGLVATIMYIEIGHPMWVWDWLWVSYVILFAGELRAWWWPYLFSADPVRAKRYQTMFGNTSAFLPERNGIVPNTLHVGLHVCTFLTILTLAVMDFVSATP